MKLLVDSLRLKTSQRCSKTMPRCSLVERWGICKKVELKEVKDNFRSIRMKIQYKIKAREGGTKGLKACKVKMIF